MRVSNDRLRYIKQLVKKQLYPVQVFLFGSRADDTQKGGDIDILIIGERRLSYSEKSSIRIEYIKKYGDQKIDIVSFSSTEKDAFKDYIFDSAIPL